MGLRCTSTLIITLFLVSACETVEKDSVASESLWGEGGAVAYPQAAQRMASSSPAGEVLDARDRSALRPIFSDLVDRVVIHWNSEPLDQVAAAEYGVQVGTGDTEGQTYGLDIYIRGPRSAWPDRERLQILIHELTHSEQFERYGSDLEVFGYEYFRQYYIGGQVYENNPLEQEAINRANAEIENVLNRF